MRRLLVVLLVAACLLPGTEAVRAQATADQLNKLSLEALTTPAPGGNPGPSYRRRAAQRSFYRGLGRSRSYAHRSARSYRRSYGAYRPSYRTSYRSSYRRTDQARYADHRVSARRSFPGYRAHAASHYPRRRHR